MSDMKATVIIEMSDFYEILFLEDEGLVVKKLYFKSQLFIDSCLDLFGVNFNN